MIIKNKILPPKKYSAMAIYPFIFTRKEINKYTLSHEYIHFEQQKELFIIFFYILYLIFHLIFGYYRNPFELEAYRNSKNIFYHQVRNKFAWRHYINFKE